MSLYSIGVKPVIAVPLEMSFILIVPSSLSLTNFLNFSFVIILI